MKTPRKHSKIQLNDKSLSGLPPDLIGELYAADIVKFQLSGRKYAAYARDKFPAITPHKRSTLLSFARALSIQEGASNAVMP
jgi:hypothetical protein